MPLGAIGCNTQAERGNHWSRHYASDRPVAPRNQRPQSWWRPTSGLPLLQSGRHRLSSAPGRKTQAGRPASVRNRAVAVKHLLRLRSLERWCCSACRMFLTLMRSLSAALYASLCGDGLQIAGDRVLTLSSSWRCLPACRSLNCTGAIKSKFCFALASEQIAVLCLTAVAAAAVAAAATATLSAAAASASLAPAAAAAATAFAGNDHPRVKYVVS